MKTTPKTTTTPPASPYYKFRAITGTMSLRLPLEVIAWLKADGPGHYVRAAQIIVDAFNMDAFNTDRKKPGNAPRSPATRMPSASIRYDDPQRTSRDTPPAAKSRRAS